MSSIAIHQQPRDNMSNGEQLTWAICSEEFGPLDFYSTRSAAEYALSLENYNPRITVREVLSLDGEVD